MDRNFQRMREGFNTAFIDGSTSSDAGFRPQFISNDYRRGKKVVAAIERELKRCDEFFISAAFITRGGITPLLQTLKELESRGELPALPMPLLMESFLLLNQQNKKSKPP